MADRRPNGEEISHENSSDSRPTADVFQCTECGHITYSRRTLRRHRQMGCAQHAVDRRTVGIKRGELAYDAPDHTMPPHTQSFDSGLALVDASLGQRYPPDERASSANTQERSPCALPPVNVDTDTQSEGGSPLSPPSPHSCEEEPPNMVAELVFDESHSFSDNDWDNERDGSEDGSAHFIDPDVDDDGAGVSGERQASDMPNRKTAQWYIDRKDSMLYPGCDLTVEGQCYALLRAKMEHHLTDKYVDDLCKYTHHVLLPPGNLHPPSLYLLKKVCKVPETASFEKHVCVNDCCRFDDIPPEQYAEHVDDVCPECKEPRFELKAGRGARNAPVYVSRKVFWELRVEDVVRGWFSDPEWCANRGRNRDMYLFDFYSSPEADRIDLLTDGALRDKDNSCVELGMDWFQCFEFKQHSVGLVGMR